MIIPISYVHAVLFVTYFSGKVPDLDDLDDLDIHYLSVSEAIQAVKDIMEEFQHCKRLQIFTHLLFGSKSLGFITQVREHVSQSLLVIAPTAITRMVNQYSRQL